MTNKEIARELGLGAKTIEFHVTKLLRKFRVSSRFHLIDIAQVHGCAGVCVLEAAAVGGPLREEGEDEARTVACPSGTDATCHMWRDCLAPFRVASGQSTPPYSQQLPR